MRFYHAPLGVDTRMFRMVDSPYPRPIGVVTSGFVSGPQAEAIEEVAEAALLEGLNVYHLGPRDVVGMRPRMELSWWAEIGVTDRRLSEVYGQSLWVSGLRHVEGFELPVLEGVMCGARPIVFDRPETRRWFDGHAVFVKEEDGPALVRELREVFSRRPEPVGAEEHRSLREKFAWEVVARGFWDAVREGGRL